MIGLIVFILVVGVLMWAVNTLAAPYIAPPFLKIANVVAVVFVILVILNAFGVLPLGDYALPRLR